MLQYSGVGFKTGNTVTMNIGFKTGYTVTMNIQTVISPLNCIRQNQILF